MSLKRLADGTPAPAATLNGSHASSVAEGPGRGANPFSVPQRGQSVMPAGPDVDVNTILSPLIDGSYSTAQGQAAIMAGVRVPTTEEGTRPIAGTAPLVARPAEPVPAAPVFNQVPPSLVNAIVQRVLTGIPVAEHLQRTPEVEQTLAERYRAVVSTISNIPPSGYEILFKAVLEEILGLGPLEPLLTDDSISEIMVNGPTQVWIERSGHLVESGITFLDEAHVYRVAQRIVAPLGRRLDHKWPMVDARLPDGSRVNIIAPPCSLQGTTITIRKFFRTPLQVGDLVRFGTITPPMADFLRLCVQGRLNIVVSGGTGSGKTTLLNVLSSFIPEGERIVTIEDSAELRLNQRHVVSLESKPADAEDSPPVTIRHLVINALRMRPERIIVGECRSGETLDMLQAMNTGHDGSLTTLHANTPRDALARMETMVMMSGMDLPVRVIREQVASAIDLFIQQARLRDGTRKVTYITEVQGMEGDTIVLQDIFRFREQGVDSNGRVLGRLQATGLVPNFVGRLENEGQMVDRAMFKQ